MKELEDEKQSKLAKRKAKAKARDRKRLWNKTVNQAQQINTSLRFEDLPISSSGWMGRRFDEADNANMKRMWKDRTIEAEMVNFQRVHFDTE